LAVLVAVWVVLAMVSGGGPGKQEFDKAVANTAQGALSAVRTAQLAGQAALDGRATRTFLSPVLDNALQGVVTAQRELAQTPPPSDTEVGTRDELSRLLNEGARATGDLVAAVHRGDDREARAAVAALGSIGDRLAGFMERHQP
jgi:hypothetical protein